MAGSRRSRLRRISVISVPVLVLAALGFSASQAQADPGASARLIGTSSAVTGSFTPSGAGDVTDEEFMGEPDDAEGDAGPPAYDGTITDRSLSNGHGTASSPSAKSGPKAKSNPQLGTSFEGLNLYQQRYARGGNQFTVEPPDQALCVGNGFVVEAVNDVLNVYDKHGTSVLPDNTATNIVSGFPRNVDHAVDLNSFFGYGPAINRATGVRAQSITDPVCLYDAATQRFFVAVLTLESQPNGVLTHQNHIDIAVSRTSNPTGQWNIFSFDVTNDGTNTGGQNPGPYLGDYPHIGADANGVYITTNAYPWCCNGFSGAQIYALSKAQLAAGASTVTMAHIDTSGAVPLASDAGATQPGFTVWPAQSPGTSSFETAAGGTEYFLSSNAADEATHPVAGTGGNYVSDKVIVWALTNTSSLNGSTAAVSLTAKPLTSEQYAIPPKAKQPGSGAAPTAATPQGTCINDTSTVTIAGTGCWRLLVGAPGHEVVSRPDSNDTRMQQVMYANGKLWGALDTAVNPDGGTQRAGIAWFIVKPTVASGSLSATMAKQGYLAKAGADLTYPAIGVTASGRGVMAFTYMSDASGADAVFPSAAYAAIDALVGTGPISIAAAGQATDDGFTSYKAQVGGNPPRTRWGDYGAAAVDGKSVWIASEYIASACDYTVWGGPFFVGGSGDNLLGTCAGAGHGAGPRTALGNWSTRVSEVTP